MSLITWTRVGGRRYPQWTAPSMSGVGIVWPSVGTGGAAVVPGAAYGVPAGWWLILWC